jgi:uncharacterized protein
MLVPHVRRAYGGGIARLERQLIWQRAGEDASLEYAYVTESSGSFGCSGVVIATHQGQPMYVEYQFNCDGDSRTRKVEVRQTFEEGRRYLSLESDGKGTWLSDGKSLPHLQGCTDIDLGITPSTNALPIRRLSLPVAGRERIHAAWVRFPMLEVATAEQEYERLASRRYRYKSLASGFEAVLDVDDLGLPVVYAGIWRRVAVHLGAATHQL